jgi:hypothetical protein
VKTANDPVFILLEVAKKKLRLGGAKLAEEMEEEAMGVTSDPRCDSNRRILTEFLQRHKEVFRELLTLSGA